MAIGSYTKTTYVNGSAPAINATNLNNAENQIKEITDAAVSGGASPTKIWTNANDGTGSGLDADKVDNIEGTAFWYSSSGTGGSDGNGGQPPAPKPNKATNTGTGYVSMVKALAGNPIVVPGVSSETYYGVVFGQDTSTKEIDFTYSGVSTNLVGGATWIGAATGKNLIAHFWRIS